MHRPVGPMGKTALIVVVFLLVALAATAWARAGGGGRYGGSGGGGGGGGGEGLGILFYYLILLAINKPLIGIPLLLVAIYLVYKFSKSAKSGHQTRTISKAGRLRREQGAAQRDAMLDSLTERDPGFTIDRFLTMAGKAFIEVQKAWSDQDMTKVRHFVSDGILERFGLQIEMQKAENYRNLMQDIKILHSEIVAVQSDKNFDTIHVEIRAQAVDKDVDLETGKTLRTNSRAPFTEYWSFLRKPGVQTLKTGGLVEGFCPNCGASIQLSDSGKCENCDSMVSSGEYDWVMAEITQAIEWSAIQKPEMIPGYTKMVGLDPAFNLQHIEDRASVIFWRITKAWFENDPSVARKMLLPVYYEKLQKSIKGSRGNETWMYFREAAVGAVEVQKIIPGEGSFDRIEVLVKWSARNARRDATGKSREAGNKTIRPQVYVLIRKQGVRTPAEMTFMSSHCPGCGAPYGESAAGECDYCGRVLNDGSQDWVLENVEPFHASRISAGAVAALDHAALVPPDLILSAMAATMYADGEIDEKEMNVLQRFARSRGISEKILEMIVSTVESEGQNLPRAESTMEAKQVLEAMAQMALADGKLTSDEKAMLYGYGSSNGLSRADVNLAIAEQKKALYRRAKQVIKEEAS